MKTLVETIDALNSSNSLTIYTVKEEKEISYADLKNAIKSAAVEFQAQGIRQDTPVLMCLVSDLEHIVSFLALIYIGALPVSIKPPKSDMAEFFRNVESLSKQYDISHYYKAFFPIPNLLGVKWSGDIKSNLEDFSYFPVSEDDLAFIQFSSGSTTEPKAVPIKHGALLSNMKAITKCDERHCDMQGLCFLPLNHDMGLVGGLLSNFIYQNPLIVIDVRDFLRQPVECLAYCAKYKVEVLMMPNFILQYLHNRIRVSNSKLLTPDMLSSFKTVYCGAEPIKYDSVFNFLELGKKYGLKPESLFLCYGMAESTLIVTGKHLTNSENDFDQSPLNTHVASVGVPVADVEIRITDLTSSTDITATGKVGKIEIKGNCVFDGYWKKPSVLKDGWFDTQDLGYFKNSELFVCGRSKDMVIVGGENIFCTDIENSLSVIPGIAESVAMVQNDEVHLLIIPKKEAAIDEREIRRVLGSSYGISTKSVFVGTYKDVVRTTSGKPMRHETLNSLEKKLADINSFA